VAPVGIRLGRYLNQTRYLEKAETTIRAFYPLVQQRATSLSYLLIAMDLFEFPVRQMLIMGSPQDAQSSSFVERVFKTYFPWKTILWADGGKRQRYFENYFTYLKGVDLSQWGVAVCSGQSCQLPSHQPSDLEGLLVR
jgi:uncharacterized protein YyaL (SSP411 family)